MDSVILSQAANSRPVLARVSAPIIQVRESANDAHQPEPSIDIRTVSYFIRSLDDGNDTFNFRLIPIDESRDVLNLCGSLDDQEFTDQLVAKNLDGYGVFVVVNEGGHNDKSITRIRGVFADFDAKHGHELPGLWDIEPHIIVESSRGSFHAYWFVDGLLVDQFRDLQKSIAQRCGSDPTVCNPSRVMRVPGFIHRKRLDDGALTEPFVSHIIHESGAQPYSAEKILAAFPPTVEQSTATHANTSERAIVNESGRNHWLTQRAGQLRRQDWSEGAIRTALHAENVERCNPPLPVSEVDAIARSIMRYAPEPMAAPTTAEDQATIDALGRSFDKQLTLPPRKFGFIHVGKLISNPKPIAWLVRDHIEQNSLAEIAGAPGSGKSFCVIDLALCVALGVPWCGHRVAPGAVFYILGEGTNGISRRMLAWGLHNGHDISKAPIYVSRCAALIDQTQCVAEVVQAIDELVDANGVKPALIVIDTLARSMSGDENKQEDMNRFIAGMDTLRDRWGAAVLVVHHTGASADAQERPRGSTNNPGAIDFLGIMLKSNGVHTLKCKKMKEGEEPPPLAFKLNQIQLPAAWADPEDGRLATSAVLVPCDSPAVESDGMTDRQRLVLDVITSLSQSSGKVTRKDATAALIERGMVDRVERHRVLTQLAKRGSINVDREHVSLGVTFSGAFLDGQQNEMSLSNVTQ